MTLKQAIECIGLRPLAKRLRISKSTLHRYVSHGTPPKQRAIAEMVANISAVLEEHGVNPATVDWPTPRPAWETDAAAPPDDPFEEITLMQLDRQVLALFGLRQNPFLNDVEADEDVFVHKGYQATVQSVKDAIEERGFLALIAPSGAGKTTIWDSIESEYGMRTDFVLCKPALKSKEKLSPEHLVRALLYGLNGEDTMVHRDGEQRGRQLSRALMSLRQGTLDRRAVLYIDDAHFANQSVLRQLKTFYEEKIGRFRLLSIILVGLPSLKEKLAAFPEIGNRIRITEVPPVPVKEYLEFKLRRTGSSLDQMFAAGGVDAFLDRFRAPRRPALGFPLIINATMIRCMVRLYENGAQPGEKISREIVDSLPGGATRRAVA